jgi:ribonuclease HI
LENFIQIKVYNLYIYKNMDVYTDGSCLGNPGPGGWAVIGPGFELSGGLEHTTNNAMELTAALKCLEHTGKQPVTIYTDSCYLKNGITKWILNWKKNGWKTAAGQPIKNREIWIQIDDLAGAHVTWKWVKAHNGHPFNEAVDKLAYATATSFKK